MGKPVEMVSGSRNSNRELLREVTREEKGRGGGESRAVEERRGGSGSGYVPIHIHIHIRMAFAMR